MLDDRRLKLESYLNHNRQVVSKIVPFDPVTERVLPFDFTVNNPELDGETLSDTQKFDNWIANKLQEAGCRYGLGGYNEHRTLYSRSSLFDQGEEPRRLHLGVDIWGAAGTPVCCPLPAIVHSFKYNDHFGDYGATIILEHQLDDLKLHSLYGHLSLLSLEGLEEGEEIKAGVPFAEFGTIKENGHWPPHLHFQLIFDMKGYVGDYPGVCRFSQREIYLENCPDPNLILRHTFQL